MRSLARILLLCLLLAGAASILEWDTLAEIVRRDLLLAILIVQPFLIAGFGLAAWRLLVLVHEARPRFMDYYKAILLTYCFNIVLPAHGSELLKLTYLRDRAGVTVARLLSAVGLERLSDIFMLATLTAVGAVLLLFPAPLALVAAAVAALVALAALPFLERPLRALATRFPWRRPREIVMEMIAHASLQLRTGRFLGAAALTVLIWALAATSIAAFLAAAGYASLGLAGSFLVFLAFAVGSAIPALPAGFGTFEAAIMLVLHRYGYSFSEALVIAVALHVSCLLVPLLGGMVVLLRERTGVASALNAARDLARTHSPAMEGARGPEVKRPRGSHRLSARIVSWITPSPRWDTVFRNVVMLAAWVGRWLTRFRLRMGRPRSLWGVTPIITLRLKARCDRLLGIRSETLVYTTYHVVRDFDHDLSGHVEWLHARVGGNYLDSRLSYFCHLVFAWALLRYDFISCFHDRGLLTPFRSTGIDRFELEMLRSGRKRLYVYSYGADVRTRKRTQALGRWNCCVDCPEPGKFCICDDDYGSVSTEITANYAAGVVTMGDFHEYARSTHRFDYWPVDLDAIQNLAVPPASGPLRVVHVPNHPHFKGSRYLMAAIDRLNREGASIDFETATGVSNDDVLKLLGTADLVVDQLIIGTHGYTTLESMARGKPVICYVRNPDYIMAASDCPVINANPDSVYDALKWCSAHRAELAALGQAGRRYVERYHSLPAIAARLGRMYLKSGSLPPRFAARLARRVDQLEREVSRFPMAGAGALDCPFLVSRQVNNRQEPVRQ